MYMWFYASNRIGCRTMAEYNTSSDLVDITRKLALSFTSSINDPLPVNRMSKLVGGMLHRSLDIEVLRLTHSVHCFQFPRRFAARHR